MCCKERDECVCACACVHVQLLLHEVHTYTCYTSFHAVTDLAFVCACFAVAAVTRERFLLSSVIMHSDWVQCLKLAKPMLSREPSIRPNGSSCLVKNHADYVKHKLGLSLRV